MDTAQKYHTATPFQAHPTFLNYPRQQLFHKATKHRLLPQSIPGCCNQLTWNLHFLGANLSIIAPFVLSNFILTNEAVFFKIMIMTTVFIIIILKNADCPARRK